MSEKSQEIVIQPSDLSVNFTDTAMARHSSQRVALREFVQNQLTLDVDFGTIPGTPKPTLYKPGAEKLANLFQLGSRIVKQEKEIDRKENFAMFTYTIEIFHLPTGNAIAQCEGSANSFEKKFLKKTFGDVMNTLQKMAQKRAYVGAIIIATGGSDFFTQDLEDADGALGGQKQAAPAPAITPTKSNEDLGDYVVKFGKHKEKTLSEIGYDDVADYRNFLVDSAAKDKKPLGGSVKEFVDAANQWLS